MTSNGSGVEEVYWHDIECGRYAEDLELWRVLTDACGGTVLDVGAGTGRVSLDLAALGHDVVAVDSSVILLEALADRARALGVPGTVQTVWADARQMTGAAGRYPLVIVPMQTVQLFGGRTGRRAFLRAMKPLLSPGGLLAMAIADPLGVFDGEADGLPATDQAVIGGALYSSQMLAMTHTAEQATIHRLRTVDGVRDEYTQIALDLVTPDELRDEALMLGYTRRPHSHVAETLEYVGSTVVIVGA